MNIVSKFVGCVRVLVGGCGRGDCLDTERPNGAHPQVRDSPRDQEATLGHTLIQVVAEIPHTEQNRYQRHIIINGVSTIYNLPFPLGPAAIVPFLSPAAIIPSLGPPSPLPSSRSSARSPAVGMDPCCRVSEWCFWDFLKIWRLWWGVNIGIKVGSQGRLSRLIVMIACKNWCQDCTHWMT